MATVAFPHAVGDSVHVAEVRWLGDGPGETAEDSPPSVTRRTVRRMFAEVTADRELVFLDTAEEPGRAFVTKDEGPRATLDYGYSVHAREAEAETAARAFYAARFGKEFSGQVEKR